MILHEKIPVSNQEKDFEIRVYYNDQMINVVAFQDNHPLNGFRHQIKLPKKCDVRATLENGVAGSLIAIAKEDILENRWEEIRGLIEVC